jgi:hypothetical protein
VSSLSRRIIEQGMAEPRRWLSGEHGIAIPDSTFYRFAYELREAIQAEYSGESIRHRYRHQSAEGAPSAEGGDA